MYLSQKKKTYEFQKSFIFSVFNFTRFSFFIKSFHLAFLKIFFSLFFLIENKGGVEKFENKGCFLILPSFEKIYQGLKFFNFHHIPVLYKRKFSFDFKIPVKFQISRCIENTISPRPLDWGKKIIFYTENPFQNPQVLSGRVLKVFSSFLYFNPVKAPGIKLLRGKNSFFWVKQYSKNRKIQFNTKKNIYFKPFLRKMGKFFLFWELRNQNIIKGLVMVPDLIGSKKTQLLINSSGFRTEIIGPWLTKRKILRKLKRFNSSFRIFLILCGPKIFYKNIIKRIDLREIPLILPFAKLNSKKEAIFV